MLGTDQITCTGRLRQFYEQPEFPSIGSDRLDFRKHDSSLSRKRRKLRFEGLPFFGLPECPAIRLFELLLCLLPRQTKLSFSMLVKDHPSQLPDLNRQGFVVDDGISMYWEILQRKIQRRGEFFQRKVGLPLVARPAAGNVVGDLVESAASKRNQMIDSQVCTSIWPLAELAGEAIALVHLEPSGAGDVTSSVATLSGESVSHRVLATPSSMGLAWPASYCVMAEREIPARFDSSDRASPARLRAWRITDPSIVSMTSRYPIAYQCRKATPSRKAWVAGVVRESADCRRAALGPQRQPKLVTEQLVLWAAARVRLAGFEDLSHAFAA